MNEGKKDRRDPIRTIKPKNPVAKNASAAIGGGAAGAHKDKKKAMKAGEVKHKKAEYAESYEQHLQNKLDEAAKVDPNAPFDYDKWKSSGKTTTPKHFGPKGAGTKLAQQTRDATAKKKEQGVAEGGYNYNQPDPAWVTINGKRWKWFFNYVSARKAMDTLNAKYRKEGSNKKADWEPAELEDNPDYGIKVSEAMNGITGPGRMDGPLESADYDQGEYDDEAGMAQGNLHTIAQAAQGLLDNIDDRDNLPEWAQEKIAKVEGMLVSVWNYLQSQKAQGIDPKVSEGQSALEKFRKDSAEREKKHSDIEAKRKATAAQGKTDVKGAVDRLEKAVKGEGWTHDSLADELFEHERTYEERLQNQLRLKLSK